MSPYVLDLDFNLPEFKSLLNLSLFESWLMNPISFNYRYFKPYWLKATNLPIIMERLKGNENIERALRSAIIQSFDKELAHLYFKYFAIPISPMP